MTLIISKTEHSRDPQPYPDVHHVQARLVSKGISIGPYGVDGKFGEDTDVAVRTLQRRYGLLVDGRVGTDTLKALDASVAYSSVNADDFVRKVYNRVCGLDGAGRPVYRLGAEVANLATAHPMALDCSEAVQWGVFQITRNSWVDGSWIQASKCRLISVDQAARTPGALLFISSNGYPSGVHHVAVSRGLGRSDAHGTAEARSAHLSPQCGSWAIGSRFSFGGLIPILRYS